MSEQCDKGWGGTPCGKCHDCREAFVRMASEIARLTAERDEARAENSRLRAEVVGRLPKDATGRLIFEGDEMELPVGKGQFLSLFPRLHPDVERIEPFDWAKCRHAVTPEAAAAAAREGGGRE